MCLRPCTVAQHVECHTQFTLFIHRTSSSSTLFVGIWKYCASSTILDDQPRRG